MTKEETKEFSKIIKALLSIKEDVSKLDPWLPLPQNSCCFLFGKDKKPLPIGAIMLLWENCPEAVWECGKCGGKAYSYGFGGLLSVGGFTGCCIECGEYGFNWIGGISAVKGVVKPHLENTPYKLGGMCYGATYKGEKQPLLDALMEMGVKDLPDKDWQNVNEESHVSLTVGKNKEKLPGIEFK